MSTYFCDGIKEVTLINGVARLEFYRLQRNAPGGTDRDLEPTTELFVALPAQGLLQALAALESVRDRLVEQGVLKPAPTETTGQPQPPPERSPNFP